MGLRTSRPVALTAAERARTLLAGCTTVRVRVPGVVLEVHRHGLTPDGSLLFQAPADLDLTLGEAEATAIDVTAVPQPDRIRGTVTLVGALYEVTEPLPAGMRAHLTGTDVVGNSRLVRLVPHRVTLDWRCERRGPGEPVGELDVPVTSYRVAFPDALLGYEAEWLPHLQADHAELLEVLACHELGLEDDHVDVRALGLDRYGVVLRVLGPTSVAPRSYDVRIPFDQPISCGCDVRQAFSTLLERAAPGIGPVC